MYASFYTIPHLISCLIGCSCTICKDVYLQAIINIFKYVEGYSQEYISII